MADKPSRGLVLFGDGLAPFIEPSHTHLHSLASLACCGFLSLPHSPPSETEDVRIVREFAQLLDACDACMEMSGEDTEKLSIQNISERFMGMKAAIVTDNTSLKSFGGKLGISMLQLNELIGSHHSSVGQSHDVLAFELLKLLGFQEGKILETNQFDLVFLHVGACKETDGQKGIDYVNALVGALMQMAQPGSEIGSRLHLSLILSYGCVSEDEDPRFSVSITNHTTNSDLLLFPRQSFTMKGINLRKEVRHHCPMLLAQWQSGVTRKDMVEKFSFLDFKENCGNLTVPADRFIHEVAFKLWKAPKYGA